MAWIYDVNLSGSALNLVELNGTAKLLYVFSGEAIVGEERLGAGDSILFVDEQNISVSSESSAELVLFLVDPRAAVSRSGTLSGSR